MSNLKNVTYYSASAGTGKTFTLTELLAKTVKDGVSPCEVILTTFTKTAANEFKQKCREAMFRNDLPEVAPVLDMAKVGTVHSIAQSFIQKYWFYLGISPDFQAMDEEVQEEFIKREIETVVTEEQRELFLEFRDVFDLKITDDNISVSDYDFWKTAVTEIANHAAVYGIEDLTKSREISIQRAEKVFTGKGASKVNKDKFIDALDELRNFIAGYGRITKKDDWYNSIGDAKKYVDQELTFDTVKDIEVLIKKCEKSTNPTVKEFANKLKACVPDLYLIPSVHDQVLKCIETVFDVAEHWREKYREYKDSLRIIDFSDMETMFLKLLNIDEVREDIQSNYKVLFVDEFQDSSPIQIDIFNRLAALMKQCYWVGDYKQSIYGFRGTDLDLVQSVVKNVGGIEHLGICRRSSQKIIDLVNDIFVEAFKDNGGLDENDVKVCHWDKKVDGESDGAYIYEISGKDFYGNLATRIAQEVQKNPEKASEIAVLFKKNSECNKMAETLSKMGVAVQGGGCKIKDTDQCLLIASLLRLVVNAKDDLARAEIAYLVEDQCTTGKIIEERIDGTQEDFLGRVPLLQKFMALRPTLVGLSVKSIVETLVVELNLNEVTAFMEYDSCAIFNAIIEAAEEYESQCAAKITGATVTGFIGVITKDENLLSKGDPSGVVIKTYHKSKGLDWNKVFLCSLDKGLGEDESIIAREFLGVNVCKSRDFSIENMGSTTTVCYVPNVFGKKASEGIANSLLEDADYEECKKKKKEEYLRLLYVGMTRPKNQLILVKKDSEDSLNWFSSLGIEEIAGKVQNDKTDMTAGTVDIKSKVLKYSVETGNATGTPRDISPSSTYASVVGDVEVVLPEAEVPLIPVDWKAFAPDEMNLVGTCIHNIFAGLDSQETPEVYAKNMIESQGMQKCLPDAGTGIINAWNRFVKFLTDTYGEKVQVYHELPFSHLTQEGQIVTGSMDFVWQTKDGMVLVDFKNLFQGTYRTCLSPTAEHFLGKYKGQFDCYQKALEAHGEKILDRLIYQPITGRVVRIG